MPLKIFIPLFGLLMAVLIITSPPVLRAIVPQPVASATASPPSPTLTPSPRPTTDPFAFVPTATPFGARQAGDSQVMAVVGAMSPGLQAIQEDAIVLATAHSHSDQRLFPSAATPALTPELTLPATSSNAVTVLPDSVAAATQPLTPAQSIDIPPAPTPSGARPDRLLIPRLNLDVPVEEVGLVASDVAPDVSAWGVPAYRAAGWLNTSAPLGQPGNTVLDGHHNVLGEVFRDLWTLQAGDEITLMGAGQTRQYRVSEVLILPERDQPLAVRLANARYIQPTGDERLTLVTCWPYEDNSHRTVVVAFPGE
jgi:sortase A